MKTFDGQKVTKTVEIVEDITRWEFVVNNNHMISQDALDGDGEVTGAESVPDGGPDLDVFIYVGGDRSENRRQWPREKVIADWKSGKLKTHLVKIFDESV